MSATSRKSVIVALSGGVDSAVAALRLQRAGYSVAALHMTNWDDADEYCTAAGDFADAQRVAEDLGIALHHVNFAREYREQVFAGRCDSHDEHRVLDTGIERVIWLARDELLARTPQLRSPMVLRAIDDYLAGQRHPLDFICNLAPEQLLTRAARLA